MILDELKAAIVLRDYSRAVELASANLDAQHHQYQWASILDYRAFALGMQSKFEAAVNDAQKLMRISTQAARLTIFGTKRTARNWVL